MAVGAYFINGLFHDVQMIWMMNMTLFFLAGLAAGLRPLTMPGNGRASSLTSEGDSPIFVERKLGQSPTYFLFPRRSLAVMVPPSRSLKSPPLR